MTAKHVQPRLGRNQRLALGVLFDHGVWQHGAPYGVGTDTATMRVMASLYERGLARCDRLGRYCLTPAGYAWLIRDAAGDLSMIDFAGDAALHVTTRISHLAQCFRLTGVQGQPVDWRGNPV